MIRFAVVHQSGTTTSTSEGIILAGGRRGVDVGAFGSGTISQSNLARRCAPPAAPPSGRWPLLDRWFLPALILVGLVFGMLKVLDSTGPDQKAAVLLGLRSSSSCSLAAASRQVGGAAPCGRSMTRQFTTMRRHFVAGSGRGYAFDADTRSSLRCRHPKKRGKQLAVLRRRRGLARAGDGAGARGADPASTLDRGVDVLQFETIDNASSGVVESHIDHVARR